MTARRGRTRAPADSRSSSTSTSPEREKDDDGDSFTEHGNDSVSSLGVSLEEMDLDSDSFEELRKRSPISCLPAELLIGIFSKLSSPADIKSCMLVSRSWARNSVDLLWYRPSTNSLRNLQNVCHTIMRKNGYFAYHDLIKRLNLAQLADSVTDGTIQPLTRCKRIERLTLTNCSKLTDDSVEALIDKCRNLYSVDVSCLNLITDRSLLAVAKNCFKLQGLNISSCRKVTNESVAAIAKNCRRVKRLKFNDCGQLTDYSIKAVAENCHDIVEIDLFGCGQLTDQSVTALMTEGRQLRELRLAHCVRLTDEAFTRLPMDAQLESLRILDLTDCNELQDGSLMRISQVATRLRTLVLAKCRNITDKGVKAIARLGKNLHYIHLGHCARITDDGVIHLVKSCNRIRYIDMACCSNLTDNSIQMLSTLPKLKRIGLVKCNQITDESIKALARPKPFNSASTFHTNILERLHLSYCTNLTIDGVRSMLIHCLRLTHLSLTGVHEFLREDLLRFCREAPPDFTDHQRDVFCVFSGTKVHQLRQHLERNYRPSAPPSDADSETEEAHMAQVQPGHTYNGQSPMAIHGNANIPGHHHWSFQPGQQITWAQVAHPGYPHQLPDVSPHTTPPQGQPPPPPMHHHAAAGNPNDASTWAAVPIDVNLHASSAHTGVAIPIPLLPARASAPAAAAHIVVDDDYNEDAEDSEFMGD